MQSWLDVQRIRDNIVRRPEANDMAQGEDMKRTLLAAALSLALCATFSNTAFAAEGSGTSNIHRLYYYEGHAGLLVIVNNMEDLGGCGNSAWFLLPNTHAHYKEMVALLMSAQAQDKQVNLAIGDCFQGYGRIRHVVLIP